MRKSLKLLMLASFFIAPVASSKSIPSKEQLEDYKKRMNCTDDCFEKSRPNLIRYDLQFIEINCDAINSKLTFNTYSKKIKGPNELKDKYSKIFKEVEQGYTISFNGEFYKDYRKSLECNLSDIGKAYIDINYYTPVKYSLESKKQDSKTYKVSSSPVYVRIVEKEKEILKFNPNLNKAYEEYSLESNKDKIKFCFVAQKFCKESTIEDLKIRPLDGTPSRNIIN